MRVFIDTLFSPLIGWFDTMISYLSHLSVPLSRPIRLADYFGYIALLGPYWVIFIQQVLLMAFIYVVCYVIVAYQGLFISFKNTVKWW